MSVIEAAILGIVQGLTEYLPISSSGHLQLFHTMFGLETSNNLMFDIILHIATCCSTILVYHKYIGKLLSESFLDKHFNESKQYTLSLFISCIPVLLVGMFLTDKLENIYEGNLILLGICFIGTAGCLWLSSRVELHNTHIDLKQKISYRHALIIGLAQAVAVLPGLSRSGLTISSGLICGIEKKTVASFSFLMVLIPVFGKAGLDIVKLVQEGQLSSPIPFLPAAVGFLSAFLVGYFACKWMIKLVSNNRFTFFAYYCAIIGICTLIYGFCKG